MNMNEGILVQDVQSYFSATVKGRKEMRKAIESRQDIQGEGQEIKSWPKVAIIVLNWNGWREMVER